MELVVRNVQRALPDAIDLIAREGYYRDTRYGRVKKINGPVSTIYTHPKERVLFWKQRDSNPFFHLFESLWLIAGRNDVKWIAPYAKKISEFSDNGKTFHGGYGKRWRSWFGIDQLAIIIKALKDNPEDRRCVLQMWDCKKDLGKTGKDFPCNTQVYFSINKDNELDMTVTQRSGDIIWGVYGANAVHMSVLQEYVAVGIGRPVGRYIQFTNDYHAYLATLEPLLPLADLASDPYKSDWDLYKLGTVETTPVVDIALDLWTEDLHIWMKNPYKIGLRSRFFKRVATPMHAAWKLNKEGATREAIRLLDEQIIGKSDWKIACIQWLERRVK